MVCNAFDDISHMSIELSWKEDISKFFLSYDENRCGNVNTEVTMRKEGSEEWQTGYDVHYVKQDLQPDTKYYFRLRLRNKDGVGEWSKEATARTLKAPLTGVDIHRSIKQGSALLLREILEKGEANIEAPDNLGFTPLMLAAQKNMLEMLEILLDCNANPNTKNDTGKTALMFASFKGNIECMETLLESGADVNAVDHSGLSALHMATDGEQTRAIKLLVKNGANLENRDLGLGWTPLIRCAGLKNNGNVDVACELIRAGAQIDALDNDGKTALHNCIMVNHHTLCEILLKHGARLDLTTNTGYDAFTLAESSGNQKLIQLINEYSEKRKTS
ncbi:Fibronectin type 3 and ankyrin repeat domains protein 1 [Paragonimus heterotremus]|uniref:Fibronectin type 3 and ankyrin repeat domains protein 1 n=1 Tax=Paragonimus heterotremus TaxID=100268 RepID=A0A8J4SRC2_9TREM|nr:Fibronectin type 3 and ankyrin repeat domains protein 1 [Paragonimus heterotremus]